MAAELPKRFCFVRFDKKPIFFGRSLEEMGFLLGGFEDVKDKGH